MSLALIVPAQHLAHCHQWHGPACRHGGDQDEKAQGP